MLIHMQKSAHSDCKDIGFLESIAQLLKTATLLCRFWHKVLYDIGVVSSKEPFQKLVSQGMILGEVGSLLKLLTRCQG